MDHPTETEELRWVLGRVRISRFDDGEQRTVLIDGRDGEGFIDECVVEAVDADELGQLVQVLVRERGWMADPMSLPHSHPPGACAGYAASPMEEHRIDTASGRHIDFDMPDPAQIVLEDIAGGLSRICRFGGQATQFHSVAQHAVLVSRLVLESGHDDLALAALHHDSHEAYACDLPAPLKAKLEAAGETIYTDVCEKLDLAIFQALAIDRPSAEGKALIKEADLEALMIEAAALLPDGGQGIGKARGLAIQAPERLGASLHPVDAFDRFIDAHARLGA